MATPKLGHTSAKRGKKNIRLVFHQPDIHTHQKPDSSCRWTAAMSIRCLTCEGDGAPSGCGDLLRLATGERTKPTGEPSGLCCFGSLSSGEKTADTSLEGMFVLVESTQHSTVSFFSTMRAGDAWHFDTLNTLQTLNID